MNTDAVLPISFSTLSVQKCPFEAYDRLRKEAPVCQDPVTGNYVITGYADVRMASPVIVASGG